VTARKQGVVKKFEDVKEDVRSLYATRLREAVVATMKQKAEITMTTPTAAPGVNTATPASGIATPPKP
jgi:hypothetical protein